MDNLKLKPFASDREWREWLKIRDCVIATRLELNMFIELAKYVEEVADDSPWWASYKASVYGEIERRKKWLTIVNK
jgi:hypothetical protein